MTAADVPPGRPEGETPPPAAGGSWRGALGGVLIGIGTVAIMGGIAWPVVRGMSGVLIGTALALISAGFIGRRGWWLSRLAGAAMGGFAGSFATVASAEQFPPGTVMWVLQGGAYGMLIGLPGAWIVAQLMDTLAWLLKRRP